MIHIKKPKEYFWIIISFILGVVISVAVVIILNISGVIVFKNQEGSTHGIVSDIDTIYNPVKEIISPIDNCDIFVDINGAVQKPNVYCLKNDSLVKDAISSAGGFSKNYAIDYVKRNVNLAAKLQNNMKIYIPYEKEQRCTVLDFKYRLDDVLGVSVDKSNTCISINNASVSQLTTISGIGDSTAKKIVEGRPYKKIEDLLNVSGIGESTLEKMKSKICI